MPADHNQKLSRRDGPESWRERRTVGRASHTLAGWALFNWPAVVGSMLYRIPTTWNCEQAKQVDCLSISTRGHHSTKSTSFDGREASDSRVSMCNVVTRESTTLMSCQQGGQSKHETSHTQRNGGTAAPLDFIRARSATPIETEFARQTCRLYHQRGVRCGCCSE